MDHQATLRALVIGIDDYPMKPLGGCVNDALAMRSVMIERFGAPPENVILLLAARERAALPRHAPATAEHIRAAFDNLTEQVQPGDRIFIYYSGHGGSRRVGGKHPRQVECLLPSDFLIPGNVLHDVEINARLAKLQRTAHVSVVLDCCHSAGATRGALDDEDGLGNPSARYCDFETPDDDGDAVPDAAQKLTELAAGQLVLVVAACSADEVALEQTFEDGRQGTFTRALVVALGRVPNGHLAATAWRDLLSAVISAVAPAQHPRILGDDRRPVTGHAIPLHAGDLLVEKRDGDYVVGSGSLVNITDGTRIEVSRLVSAPNGSFIESVSGHLNVVKASARRAVAQAVGPFEWPERPRCRVKRYGSPVLSVGVHGELAAALCAKLEAGGLVRFVLGKDAEVTLVEDKGDWVLCDEYFGLADRGWPELVRFDLDYLEDVLEHAAAYRAPLRLASRCSDLPGQLAIRLLDTVGKNGLTQVTPLAALEADAGVYGVSTGNTFCFELANNGSVKLHVTLINVARSGRVAVLDEMTLEPGVHQRAWLWGEIGNPYYLEGEPGFDRFVAVGTTEQGVDFKHLELNASFEDVGRGGKRDAPLKRSVEPPPPLWTSARVVIDSRPKNENVEQ